LCIVAGVIVAILLTERRLRARGGPQGAVLDVAIYAIPAGIIGARLYHVITTPEPYFGANGHLVDAVKLWQGGLGIWGAVAGGAFGAWLGCRQLGIPLRVMADAIAPGLALAQAVGRFGNWFNQELYGKPTDLPWAVEIDIDHRLPQHLMQATYHPTFLYESLWCVGVALLVLWADRRYKLGGGRVFALYAMAYVVGRSWIEYLRIDEAHHFLGLRLNDWTCLVVFVAAACYFFLRRTPRERLMVDENGHIRLHYSVFPVKPDGSRAGKAAEPKPSSDDSVEGDSGKVEEPDSAKQPAPTGVDKASSP
jgi:prolipoprotein diacylglyceryl transferase